MFIRCTCSFSNYLHRKRAGALALAVFALFQYKLVLKRLKLHFLLRRYKRSYVHFLLVSVCQKHITISLRFLITWNRWHFQHNERTKVGYSNFFSLLHCWHDGDIILWRFSLCHSRVLPVSASNGVLRSFVLDSARAIESNLSPE